MRIKQRGADQEHQGQRDFRDHQDRPRLVLPEARARSPARFLERGRQVGLRALQRRNQAKDDASEERDQERKARDPPVDADGGPELADTRQAGRVDCQQRTNADHPEDQAEHASRQRQHDALGEQLADDPAARAADRGADRDFPSPAGRPHEQEVGDVGAGDEQHQADGAGEHHEGLSSVSHQHVADRVDREAAVRAERVRILALVLVRGCRNPRLCLLERNARRQASGRLEVVPLVGGVCRNLERDPDRRRGAVFRKIEVAEHADDGVGLAAQRDGLADRIVSAIEPGLPEQLAEHHDPLGVRHVFSGREGASAQHRRAEQLEEVDRHLRRAQLLGE